MVRWFVIVGAAVLLVSACTRKPDDSAALGDAKRETNAAVDAGKQAADHAAAATENAAQAASDKTMAEVMKVMNATRDEAQEVRQSPDVQRAKDKARVVVAATREQLSAEAARARELARIASENLRNAGSSK